MSELNKNIILKEFKQIPGVGKSIAEDLWSLGLRGINDLVNKNPQQLYEELCEYKKTKVDRCMLYVFRCAVYYASTEKYDEKLLKWWNWKD